MKKNIYTLMLAGMFGTALALSGCGGGGGGVESTAVVSAPKAEGKRNGYSVQEDGYGLQAATFITSGRTDTTFTLRTAIATGLTDVNFRTVYRIDVADPAGVGKGVYSLGSALAGLSQFPGDIYIFNGRNSTMLKVVSGTISFSSFGTNAGDLVAGSLDLTFADHNSTSETKPTYRLRSAFSFILNSSAQILPTADPVPAQAAPLYAARCAGCHALGSFDMVSDGAPDISLKGGVLEAAFAAEHKGVTLTAAELRDLKVMLNAN